MNDLPLLKKYFWPYRNRLFLITIISLLCGLFQFVSLGTLAPLINIISTNQEPTGNLWNILKNFFGLFNIELNVSVLLIVLIIVFLLGQMAVFFKQTLQVNLRFKFVYDIKKQVFSQLLYADLAYHNNKKIGNFLDTILIETERAGSGLFTITQFFSDTILVIVYVLMLFYISMDLTIICFIIVAIMLLFINKMLEISKIFGRKIVDSNTEINEYTSERLSLLKLIKANSSQDLESNFFSNVVDRFCQINAKYVLNGYRIDLVFQSLIFSVAVMIVYLSLFIFQLSVGLIAVFLFTLLQLMGPLRNINVQRHDLSAMIASLSHVDQIITESNTKTTIIDGDRKFTGILENIQMKNIMHSYVPDKPVLQGISLIIGKNELVGFVGPSGGGKSTLVDLIMRLIDPTSGAIEIDGINLKEFNVKSFHAKVGLVSQDIFIFHEDVLFNICYGADEVSLERAQIAAKIAYAHEFIEQLPQGYHTPLGDRGVKLSGGQKQRIALARAIYKNPDLLILDEATSALDTESEKIIQNSINAIKHKYTIIVVAHRLSTIENADKIFVIDGGNIMESGTHTELMISNGTYAKYRLMQ